MSCSALSASDTNRMRLASPMGLLRISRRTRWKDRTRRDQRRRRRGKMTAAEPYLVVLLDLVEAAVDALGLGKRVLLGPAPGGEPRGSKRTRNSVLFPAGPGSPRARKERDDDSLIEIIARVDGLVERLDDLGREHDTLAGQARLAWDGDARRGRLAASLGLGLGLGLDLSVGGGGEDGGGCGDGRPLALLDAVLSAGEEADEDGGDEQELGPRAGRREQGSG